MTSRILVTAFDPERTTNARLMLDCQRLGYLTEPVLDLTFGLGAFWNLLPDLDVTGNDIDPARGEYREDFQSTGWETGSWPTAVLDPPYRLGGTPSTPSFDAAYGIDVRRSSSEVESLIRRGTTEAVRVSSEHALVKVQDHISSGVLQPLTHWVCEAATEGGGRLVDSLHVVGGRAQPGGTRQVRARHGYSTLLVFETKKPRTLKR